MGKDAQGTVGDEETGYAQHAGADSGVEAEGSWKGVEEVAEWEGEIGWAKTTAKCTIHGLLYIPFINENSKTARVNIEEQVFLGILLMKSNHAWRTSHCARPRLFN